MKNLDDTQKVPKRARFSRKPIRKYYGTDVQGIQVLRDGIVYLILDVKGKGRLPIKLDKQNAKYLLGYLEGMRGWIYDAREDQNSNV